MAELRKITSFQSFSDMRAQEAASKLAEEKIAKKEALKAKFASVIDELEEIDNIDFNIHSIEEGNAFIYAAAKARQEGKDEFEFNGKKYKVTLKKDTGLKESEEIVEEVNEARREVGKVITAWLKMNAHDLDMVAKIYADAMEDANFHKETSTAKSVGAPSRVKDSKVEGMGQKIASAANWDGYAIANGTVAFLNKIGKDAVASKLLAAITKYDLNESVELPSTLELEEGNAFGDAVRKAKEAGEKEFEFEGETYKVEEDVEINESERDEQVAMELYTQVAGPEGAYSEDELAKGDDKLFTKIVADAGHKGSKAKKIVDEFKKIATMESVLCEATVEMDAMDPDDKDFLKFLKKHKVTIINKEMDGPGGGHPVITMQGKRKDLEAVLADEEFGWADPDLAEYIEESFEAINESDWGTYDTPEGKMVSKELNKAWTTFAKTVDAAHKEWLKTVQKYRGDAGQGSGFRDSEGRDSVISAMEWYIEKVFMADNKFGGIDYRKYRALMGESVEIEVNEAEVKSDEEFKEYAVSVLQKAFGEEYDEAKAMEVVDGILGKVDGDYGAAVGMLTSSLGESVEVNESCGECGQEPCVCESVEEKKADGTISDDEDERRDALMAEVESAMDQLLAKIKADADDIGGSFRSPGIMYDAKKIIDNKMKKFK